MSIDSFDCTTNRNLECLLVAFFSLTNKPDPNHGSNPPSNESRCHSPQVAGSLRPLFYRLGTVLRKPLYSDR